MHNSSSRLSAVPSIDTDQHMDIYDTMIEPAFELMGIAGVHALREHQASAITHGLNNKNPFLALATGAGESLCLQIPAIVQARHEQRVTAILQPTLEIITSQVKALSAHGIDVGICSSLTSSEGKKAPAEDLNESEPIRVAGCAHGTETIINTLCGSTGKDVLPNKEQLGRQSEMYVKSHMRLLKPFSACCSRMAF